MRTNLLILASLSVIAAACDQAGDGVLEITEPDAGLASPDASAPTAPDAATERPGEAPDAAPVDVPLTITIPTTGETFDIVYNPGRVHITRLPARLRLLVRVVTSTTNVNLLPGTTTAQKCAVFDGPGASAHLTTARLEWGVLSSRIEYGPGGAEFAALVGDALAARGLPSGPFELSGPDIDGLTVAPAFLAGAISPTVPSSDAPGAPSVADVSSGAVGTLVFGLAMSSETKVTLRIGAVCDLYNGHIRLDGQVLGDQPIILEPAPQ